MIDITNGPRLTIYLGAVKSNYLFLSKKYGNTRVAAVLKSDAYGSGHLAVAGALVDAGCADFFCGYLQDALELRRHLGEAPNIFTLWPDAGGVQAHDEFNLIPILNTQNSVKKWISYARDRGKKLPVVIKVNSGMNRLGLSEADLRDIIAWPDFSSLDVIYVLSHLSCGRDVDQMNAAQLNLFNHLAEQFFPGKPKSIAASNILTLPESFSMSMVRCGLNLYGAFSPDHLPNNPLQFALKLEARVLQLLDIKVGDTVGYNKGFVAKQPRRVATLAIGYADGIPLSAGYGRFEIRVGEARVPIIGEVSMNLISVDMTDVDFGAIEDGTWLTIIDNNNGMHRLAQAANSSMHEIMVRFGAMKNKIIR